MNLLLSGPSEVLIQIIQSCNDFLQLISLASSCKRLHSVWTSHAGSIIWCVGERTLFAFDDALLAVRATEIVKKAYQSGTLPPNPFPLHQLSGAVHKPNVQELREVLNLQHMMRCIEFMLLYWEKSPLNEFCYPPEFIDLAALGIGRAWKENFYRSMYRVVYAGAAFARAYNEPFFLAAQEGRTGFSDRWAHWPTFQEAFYGNWLQPTDHDIEYLQRFPVYNLNIGYHGEKKTLRDYEHEAIYGSFAEWIVQDGMTRGKKTQPGQDSDGGSDSAQENAIGDVMRLVAAYEHLTTKIANQDGTLRYRRDSAGDAESTIRGTVRKVSVILFGVFQVEEITMPAKVEDVAKVSLMASKGVELPIGVREQTTGGHLIDPSSRRAMDIPLVLDKVRELHARFGNHHGSNTTTTPPILQIFIFILRKYFNLRFSELAFSEWENRPYLSLAEPQVFSPGESGYGVYEPA